MAQRRIKIIRTKLGRAKVWGRTWGKKYKSIEVDERARGKKELEIIIHESFHYLFPEKEEDEIVTSSVLLTNTLWHEGYRKTDNHDKDHLQDGSR